MNKLILVSIGILFAVTTFFGASSASADPSEINKTVEQNKVIKTFPETLYYTNMAPEIPQSETLTIKNVSGDSILISPTVSIDNAFKDYVASQLNICENNTCEKVASTTVLDLSKDQTKDLEIMLTLKKPLPIELAKTPLKSTIKVTGEVKHGDGLEIKQKIIPTIEESKDKLSVTGLSERVLLVLGLSGAFLMLGSFLILKSRKAKS